MRGWITEYRWVTHSEFNALGSYSKKSRNSRSVIHPVYYIMYIANMTNDISMQQIILTAIWWKLYAKNELCIRDRLRVTNDINFPHSIISLLGRWQCLKVLLLLSQLIDARSNASELSHQFLSPITCFYCLDFHSQSTHPLIAANFIDYQNIIITQLMRFLRAHEMSLRRRWSTLTHHMRWGREKYENTQIDDKLDA